jgi:cytochrome P450
MLSLANVDPFPSYEILRQRGQLVWDPGMKCWLVLSYDICKIVESDESKYRTPYTGAPPLTFEIKGGEAALSTLTGEKHGRMRRVYMRLFSPPAVAQYRTEHVIPVINHAIDRFADRGHAELVAEFADPIPSQIIASLFGLDWKDDALILHLFECHKDVMAWIGMKNSGDELTRKAKIASDELNRILLPHVLERRDSRGDDFISRIWSKAADDYGDIGVDEVLATTRDLFLGGSDTTVHSIANSIYLLLSDHSARKAVTEDQEKTLNAFVEETLRILGSPQWRFRIANADVELGGVSVKAGDSLCLLHAAANRDPKKYACPEVVDLARRPSNDHLAFNVGPRSCPGMPLARLEMRECLKTLINRLPDLRLDPGMEPPKFKYFSHRSYGPLNVLF